jgi:tripartite-type tricarboxylate transporter receptor subunit TctC
MIGTKLVRAAAAVAVISVVSMAAGPAMAQQWPAKPIRFIVPYSPGGVSDLAARLVGHKLTESLGQQVIVDNRPGGSGTIGVGAVVKSPPDGYTYSVATWGDFTVTQHLVKNIAYDPLADLEPVITLTGTPTVLAVSATSPFKSLSDVVEAAKKQPGKMSYASAGVGVITHLQMEWLALVTGTSFTHIPYKGGAPSGAAVAAGDVQIGSLAVASALPHVKSGKVRLLANMAAQRSPIIPDVPAMRELGVQEIDGSSLTAMLAPKGTPEAIIDRMNKEVAKILEMADVKEKALAGASMTAPATPSTVAAMLKRDAAAFKNIVEKAKITAD